MTEEQAKDLCRRLLHFLKHEAYTDASELEDREFEQVVGMFFTWNQEHAQAYYYWAQEQDRLGL